MEILRRFFPWLFTFFRKEEKQTKGFIEQVKEKLFLKSFEVCGYRIRSYTLDGAYQKLKAFADAKGLYINLKGKVFLYLNRKNLIRKLNS